MATNRITIRVEGSAADGGHVRLSDLIAQLEAVKGALKHTERVTVGAENQTVYYRVVDLTHNSPATIVLEAASSTPLEDHSRNVVRAFFSSMQLIRKKGEIPDDFDLAALESYRDLGAPLRKHVSKLVIKNGKAAIPIDSVYEEKVTKAIGPDELSEGSISGMLDTVKLHNTTTFEIFPTIGPKKLTCVFRPELKDKVKQGLERYVRVYGKLRYKQWAKFPYAIDAHDLEVYPPEEELPTLMEMRGIAPDLTGGLHSADFAEHIRDAWEA